MKNLIGTWRMVCWKVRTANGWEVLNSYREKEYDWEFRPDSTLIERVDGQKPSATAYRYDPAERRLVVDRSDYADDGFLFAVAEERYRVEFLSDRYGELYDLEEVEVEPDDYVLKLEMERM